VNSRNLTLTLPADLVRRAKVIAAQRDTSVSALVTAYLEQLARDDDDYEDLWRRERAIMEKGLRMRVGEITWTRDDAHDR
jgi:hypothetical protein